MNTSDELPRLVARAEEANRQVREASAARDAALAERKAALRALAAAGMTLAEIATLIGISRSRVGLILHDNKTLNPGSRKKKRPPRVKPLPAVVGEWDGFL